MTATAGDDSLLEEYDRSAAALIAAATQDSIAGLPQEGVEWPPSRTQDGALVGAKGLEQRARIVDALYRAIPARRDERLAEAHALFVAAKRGAEEAMLACWRAKREFVEQGGDEAEFWSLYQDACIKALADADLFSPDEGEAKLGEIGITHIPLSRAQAIASDIAAEPRDGGTLSDIAGKTVAFAAAAGMLATRFNYLSNFSWFGVAVWKAVTEAERAGAAGAAGDIKAAKAMMVEFMRAHQENATQLRPSSYWYGHAYSYLTRDMIDVSRRIARRTNITLPPLLTGGTEQGRRFLEHGGCGEDGRPTAPRLASRWAHTVMLCSGWGRAKRRVERELPAGAERWEAAWRDNLSWSVKVLDAFGVRVKVSVDPNFAKVAAELGLAESGRRVLFLPTHQSLLDHWIMYQVLGSPKLVEAANWPQPRPCAILARTGLAKSASIGVKNAAISIYGMSPARFDQLLESVDGNFMLNRDAIDAKVIPKMVEAMRDRPGVIYPAGTTASFAGQCAPLQHALFAQLPPDVVMIPVALRGAHSLWPKSPKGNLGIRSGTVEAVIAAPMLGELVLMPRRRRLRTQAEAADIIQAALIDLLLDPEPSRGGHD